MNIVEEMELMCPYCGEILTVLVDCSVEAQSYVEDCQVCCQPMVLDISVDDGEVALQARREDE